MLAPTWLKLLGLPHPIWVGERLNADGSAGVRRALRLGDYAELVRIAREQVSAGALALDVRPGGEQGPQVELGRFRILLDWLRDSVDVFFFADSTAPAILSGAARHLPGRVGLNSVSLARGAEPVREVAQVAAELGVPVVALLLDERGPALRAAERLDIARRLWTILIEQEGLAPEAVLFDPLTLPLRTAEGGTNRDSAIQTLETLALIKEEWAEAQTITAISNLTYALDVRARPALNALYLTNAAREGLDFAILNPQEIQESPTAVEALWAAAQYALFDGRERALEDYIEAACARAPQT